MMNYVQKGKAYHFSETSEQLKRAVWNKGRVILGYDPSIWRADACGAAMSYSEHGNRDSQYGWEIDHIYPKSKGGTDDLLNLQPLNWTNNEKKGDTYPWSWG